MYDQDRGASTGGNSVPPGESGLLNIDPTRVSDELCRLWGSERRPRMTAEPHDLVPGGTREPTKSLRAIRAALVVPQDREAFDAGLKAVLDEVRVNLDLGVLNDFVHRWWI